MKLKDKVILITGGSDGMGRSTAIEAAKEGAKIVLVARRETKLQETVAVLKDLDAEAVYYVADVKDEAALTKAVESATERFGKIDILVNNAGYDANGLAHEVSSEAWDNCFDINLKAAFITSKCVLPAMMERRDGVIINISSTAGTNPQKGLPVYSAAKAGLIMLTKAMALGYAEYNIRINSICPGVTKTTMMETSTVSEEYMNALVARIPMKKIGVPEEIAKAVIFLASDDGAYITGQAWGVDGGLSLT